VEYSIAWSGGCCYKCHVKIHVRVGICVGLGHVLGVWINEERATLSIGCICCSNHGMQVRRCYRITKEGNQKRNATKEAKKEKGMVI
jgi:hypothetical protein